MIWIEERRHYFDAQSMLDAICAAKGRKTEKVGISFQYKTLSRQRQFWMTLGLKLRSSSWLTMTMTTVTEREEEGKGKRLCDREDQFQDREEMPEIQK